jgi:hypothetical protein
LELTHLDPETHLAPCLYNSRLRLSRSGLKRVTPTAYICHVLRVELAVHGGFFAIVAVGVVVGTIRVGRDVPDVFELGGDGVVDDEVGEVVWIGGKFGVGRMAVGLGTYSVPLCCGEARRARGMRAWSWP